MPTKNDNNNNDPSRKLSSPSAADLLGKMIMYEEKSPFDEGYSHDEQSCVSTIAGSVTEEVIRQQTLQQEKLLLQQQKPIITTSTPVKPPSKEAPGATPSTMPHTPDTSLDNEEDEFPADEKTNTIIGDSNAVTSDYASSDNTPSEENGDEAEGISIDQVTSSEDPIINIAAEEDQKEPLQIADDSMVKSKHTNLTDSSIVNDKEQGTSTTPTEKSRTDVIGKDGIGLMYETKHKYTALSTITKNESLVQLEEIKETTEKPAFNNMHDKPLDEMSTNKAVEENQLNSTIEDTLMNEMPPRQSETVTNAEAEEEGDIPVIISKASSPQKQNEEKRHESNEKVGISAPLVNSSSASLAKALSVNKGSSTQSEEERIMHEPPQIPAITKEVPTVTKQHEECQQPEAEVSTTYLSPSMVKLHEKFKNVHSSEKERILVEHAISRETAIPDDDEEKDQYFVASAPPPTLEDISKELFNANDSIDESSSKDNDNHTTGTDIDSPMPAPLLLPSSLGIPEVMSTQSVKRGDELLALPSSEFGESYDPPPPPPNEVIGILPAITEEGSSYAGTDSESLLTSATGTTGVFSGLSSIVPSEQKMSDNSNEEAPSFRNFTVEEEPGPIMCKYREMVGEEKAKLAEEMEGPDDEVNDDLIIMKIMQNLNHKPPPDGDSSKMLSTVEERDEDWKDETHTSHDSNSNYKDQNDVEKGFPVVEIYRQKEKEAAEEDEDYQPNEKRRHRLIILGCLGIALLVGIIISAVLASGRNGDNEAQSVGAGSDSDGSGESNSGVDSGIGNGSGDGNNDENPDVKENREENFLRLIATMSVDGDKDPNEADDSELKAFSFLVNEDPLNLNPEDTSESNRRQISQRYSLITLWYETSGENWDDSTNWLMGEECSWFGVTCDENGAVTALNLINNNLSGGLTTNLALLNQLTNLDLSENSIDGPIHESYWTMDSLRTLRFANNALNGTLSPSVANLVNIENLYLEYNSLTGFLPSELGMLQNVDELSLYRNSFIGSLPSEVGNLKKLQMLDIDNNQITGLLPSEIGQLTNLRYLYLSNNLISGELPLEVGQLENLISLWVSDNLLTGYISAGHLANLQELSELLMGSNPFDRAPLPDFLYSLTKLTWIQWESANLSGTLSPSIGNLVSLDSLYLFDNFIAGVIPSEIGRLQALVELRLDRNEFAQTIPEQVGSLPRLEGLQLDSNYLTGQIPDSLTNLSNLRVLFCGYNFFTGTIPENIGNMESLVALRFSVNRDDTYPGVFGTIPSSIGTLTNLELFEAFENGLAGTIPTSIGNMASLVEINLESNYLMGQIPSELGRNVNLERIYLAGNQLTGTMPGSVCNSDNLISIIREISADCEGEVTCEPGCCTSCSIQSEL